MGSLCFSVFRSAPARGDVFQTLAGVLLIAFLGGVSVALVVVIRGSRRRQMRMREQLAAEIVPTDTRLVVMINRKEVAVHAVFFGLLFAMGVGSVVAGHVVVGSLVALLTGPSAALFLRSIRRRRIAMILDGEGIRLRSGSSLRWDDLNQIRLRERSTTGGVLHELALQLRPGVLPERPAHGRRGRVARADSLTVPLEMLSMDWNDVAAAVQARFGRRLLSD